MVHIGNDKRQIQSAQLICQGLKQLLREIDYDQISVTQIAQEAGVGRATFYRLFDDKSDVVIFQMEGVFETMLRNLNQDTPPNVVIATLFEFWLSRKELFSSLIQAGLYDSFQTRLASILEEKLSFIRERNQIDDRSWHYFVHIRSAMLFSALRIAITHYTSDSAIEIMQTLEYLFGNRPQILEHL